MFRFSIIAIGLLASTSAYAGENAFHADLKNPTISKVISEFEAVCFPFISHETELTPEQDRAVFQSRMVEAGYEFDGETQEAEWKDDENLSYVERHCPNRQIFPIRVEGKFTILPASEIVNPKVPTWCEYLAARSPRRKTTYKQLGFQINSAMPIFAFLRWQEIPPLKQTHLDALNSARGNLGLSNDDEQIKIRTSFPPASSCSIHVRDESLTEEMVETAVIEQDLDWVKLEVKDAATKDVMDGAQGWRQCTSEDEENYVYSVSLAQGSFVMSVKTLQDDDDAPLYGCKSPDAEG